MFTADVNLGPFVPIVWTAWTEQTVSRPSLHLRYICSIVLSFYYCINLFCFYLLLVFNFSCNMSLLFRCFQNSWKTWVWRRSLSWWHAFRRSSALCGPPMETPSAKFTQALALWMARLRYVSACYTHAENAAQTATESWNGLFCAIFASYVKVLTHVSAVFPCFPLAVLPPLWWVNSS